VIEVQRRLIANGSGECSSGGAVELCNVYGGSKPGLGIVLIRAPRQT